VLKENENKKITATRAFAICLKNLMDDE